MTDGEAKTRRYLMTEEREEYYHLLHVLSVINDIPMEELWEQWEQGRVENGGDGRRAAIALARSTPYGRADNAGKLAMQQACAARQRGMVKRQRYEKSGKQRAWLYLAFSVLGIISAIAAGYWLLPL